jgi:uncharacterized protein (DUF362 family)
MFRLPDFTVIDGIMGDERGGPRTGKRSNQK